MLRLRNYTQQDIDRLISLANDERVSRYLVQAFPYPYRRSDAEWWISTGSRENGAVTRVIEHRGDFVGNIGIVPQMGSRSHAAEIGYWIGAEYRGRGIATEALRMMTESAFAEGYAKLFAVVLAPNRASMRVLEKNGYELEGVLRREIVRGGRSFDAHRYAKHDA